MTRPAFHNTIQSDPQLMIVYDAAAKSQEDCVMEVMRKLRRAAWFQVHACLQDMDPVSLKRCLSNLQDAGLLVKDTDKANMVMGTKGKRCHQYVLK